MQKQDRPNVVATYMPQIFDLGCNCLSVLTINYVDMLVKIVEYVCSHTSLIYNMLA